MPARFKDLDYMVNDTVDGRDINMLSSVSAFMSIVAKGGTLYNKDGRAVLPSDKDAEGQAFTRETCLGATHRLNALIAMISVPEAIRPALAEKLKADYTEMADRRQAEELTK